MSAWCVVNTLPSQEERAETNLLRQGFRAWLPTIRRMRRHARRFQEVRAPVFPGYLFVQIDLEQDSWSPINGTYGVRRLLARQMRPETLPAGFVEGLQEIDGFCTQTLTQESLWPGMQVRIVSGPFAECLAVVTRLAPGERVQLLLGLLGGGVKTTMSRYAVTPEG